MRQCGIIWNTAILCISGSLLGGMVTAAESGGGMEFMLNAIRDDFRNTTSYTGVAKPSKRVTDALRAVPRELYVPKKRSHLAYFNHPLSIGHGQTISQPFIVALMTEVLQLESNHTVLEIGTGSGYQAAILAELAAKVYTIEIIPELANKAAATLASNGYENIKVRAGDGWVGWPEAAPFDAIIVTAAGPDLPPKLVAQLKPGGRMVLPIGEQNAAQMLKLVTKDTAGEIEQHNILPVQFVPLTGDR